MRKNDAHHDARISVLGAFIALFDDTKEAFDMNVFAYFSILSGFSGESIFISL
jgi:hypothetical protein